MKMLVVIGPHSRQEEIRDLISRNGARAFTEIPEVLGQGEHGKHLGTHVFPGSSALMFSVLPASDVERVVQALQELRRSFYPQESLHAFTLPAESVL
jgi:hypothetical protein